MTESATADNVHDGLWQRSLPMWATIGSPHATDVGDGNERVDGWNSPVCFQPGKRSSKTEVADDDPAFEADCAALARQTMLKWMRENPF